MSSNESILDCEDIQGHVLRGFDTDRQLIIGLKFETATVNLRMWLRTLGLRAQSLAAIHRSRQFRSFRKRLLASQPSQTATDCYLNVALSFDALERLGLSVKAVVDQSFRQPMGSIAAALGDQLDRNGKPLYSLGADWARTPDLLLLLGSDSEERLTLAEAELTAEARAVGCTQIYRELGAVLPGATEHFGFRDGISQPGPRGILSTETNEYLTPRYIDPSDARSARYSKPGQPLVWPGQFVFGYPTQREDPELPGPISDGGEPWMKNGAFLVFRRLRQDVAAFREFLTSAAPELSNALGVSVDQELAGAILVGRWKDGTPLLVSPDKPNPSISADPLAVNYFQFANAASDIDVVDGNSVRTISGSVADPFGRRCPVVAHIRKVNPRDRGTNRGSGGRTLQFQMLRRGIPFGSPFSAETAADERGLLFLAFMTSIDGQFMILNSDWMNNDSAPEAVSGHDLLVGQSNSLTGRTATIPGPHGNARLATLARWVIPMGGAFLFAPSLSLLRGM